MPRRDYSVYAPYNSIATGRITQPLRSPQHHSYGTSCRLSETHFPSTRTGTLGCSRRAMEVATPSLIMTSRSSSKRTLQVTTVQSSPLTSRTRTRRSLKGPFKETRSTWVTECHRSNRTCLRLTPNLSCPSCQQRMVVTNLALVADIAKLTLH